MNSITGDFSEIKNSIPSLNYPRGAQSTVKKKPKSQRKFPTIAPLNLDEIKREAEEAEKYESVIFTNKSEDSTKESVLKDISNKSNSFKENLDIYKTPLKTCALSTNAPKNDSFDLNFSALSIVTPVKHTELSKQIYVTPQVKTAICPDKGIVKVNSKSVFQSASKKPLVSRIDEIDETPLLKLPKKQNDQQYEKVLGDFKEQCMLLKYPFETMTIKNTEYIILNKLGKGGSSEVFAGFCPNNKKHVAIKCVSLSNNATAASYVNEVQLLQQLQNCDRIIKLYDYELLESEKKLMVVLEKGGEDLSAILNNLASQSSHIPLYMLLFYWMEMLYAVKQIHSAGIIHSDLKPANFLRDMSGLKLIDFGIASSVQTDMTSVFKTCPEGSCNYISPEALNQENSSSGSGKYKVHFKSDVWSLGCILYQLVYRHTPFHHLRNLWKKLAYITNPSHVIEFPEANWVPPKILETIKKCLRYDVRSRPSIDELIEEYEAFFGQ